MRHLYRDRVREEGALGVWLALVADLARTAPREQITIACGLFFGMAPAARGAGQTCWDSGVEANCPTAAPCGR
jgi:hypothetical protein